MNKSKIFLFLSLSFLGGVFGASFYCPNIFAKSILLLIAAASIASITVFYKNKKLALAGFCVLCFVSGILLVTVKLEKIINLGDSEKEINGIFQIAKEPETKGRMQNIVIAKDDYRILLHAYSSESYLYGDEVRVKCVAEIPENKTFDWRMYLAKDGIFYECDKAEVAKTGNNKGNRIYNFILKVKNKLNENIEKMIPAPESGLMIGLLLGGDDKLSKDVQNNFSKTGMTHIVAVSGYNVTIVAEYLMILGIFLGLWRRQAFWFAVIGIILFIALTGFPASAVRAGVMGILLIWAMKNGRLANSQNAIIFAAVVMLLINPLLLRWDIGFQLSFLATLGIVYLYPVFQGYFVKKHAAFGISELVLLTVSAQIFVLPVILFNFQKLSVISPLANLLVLPIIPATMLLGFLAVLLSFIFYPLAFVFSWFAYLPLKYETVIINFLAGLRYSSLEISISWWGVLLWYIILAGGVSIFRKAINNRKSSS